MYRHIARYCLLLGLTSLLVACGFQLRGTDTSRTSFPEAWKTMYLVTSNPNGEFSRDLSALFTANGVRWTEDGSANFSLVLGPDRFEQRNLSLNSEARVAEFELTMSSQFSVIDANKVQVMPETTVSVIKQMENDPRNVVGKAGEMRLIQTEMRTELAEQIMRRISFYAASSQSKPASP
ncbi:MAG TPA: LPS assembly lipoprotein LptE [Halioglobus sp.]